MRHARTVGEIDLHALALLHLERRDLRPELSVEAPHIGGHVAAQDHAEPPIRGAPGEWAGARSVDSCRLVSAPTGLPVRGLWADTGAPAVARMTPARPSVPSASARIGKAPPSRGITT